MNSTLDNENTAQATHQQDSGQGDSRALKDSYKKDMIRNPAEAFKTTKANLEQSNDPANSTEYADPISTEQLTQTALPEANTTDINQADFSNERKQAEQVAYPTGEEIQNAVETTVSTRAFVSRERREAVQSHVEAVAHAAKVIHGCNNANETASVNAKKGRLAAGCDAANNIAEMLNRLEEHTIYDIVADSRSNHDEPPEYQTDEEQLVCHQHDKLLADAVTNTIGLKKLSSEICRAETQELFESVRKQLQDSGVDFQHHIEISDVFEKRIINVVSATGLNIETRSKMVAHLTKLAYDAAALKGCEISSNDIREKQQAVERGISALKQLSDNLNNLTPKQLAHMGGDAELKNLQQDIISSTNGSIKRIKKWPKQIEVLSLEAELKSFQQHCQSKQKAFKLTYSRKNKKLDSSERIRKLNKNSLIYEDIDEAIKNLKVERSDKTPQDIIDRLCNELDKLPHDDTINEADRNKYEKLIEEFKFWIGVPKLTYEAKHEVEQRKSELEEQKEKLNSASQEKDQDKSITKITEQIEGLIDEVKTLNDQGFDVTPEDLQEVIGKLEEFDKQWQDSLNKKDLSIIQKSLASLRTYDPQEAQQTYDAEEALRQQAQREKDKNEDKGENKNATGAKQSSGEKQEEVTQDAQEQTGSDQEEESDENAMSSEKKPFKEIPGKLEELLKKIKEGHEREIKINAQDSIEKLEEEIKQIEDNPANQIHKERWLREQTRQVPRGFKRIPLFQKPYTVVREPLRQELDPALARELDKLADPIAQFNEKFEASIQFVNSCEAFATEAARLNTTQDSLPTRYEIVQRNRNLVRQLDNDKDPRTRRIERVLENLETAKNGFDTKYEIAQDKIESEERTEVDHYVFPQGDTKRQYSDECFTEIEISEAEKQETSDTGNETTDASKKQGPRVVQKVGYDKDMETFIAMDAGASTTEKQRACKNLTSQYSEEENQEVFVERNRWGRIFSTLSLGFIGKVKVNANNKVTQQLYKEAGEEIHDVSGMSWEWNWAKNWAKGRIQKQLNAAISQDESNTEDNASEAAQVNSAQRASTDQQNVVNTDDSINPKPEKINQPQSPTVEEEKQLRKQVVIPNQSDNSKAQGDASEKNQELKMTQTNDDKSIVTLKDESEKGEEQNADLNPNEELQEIPLEQRIKDEIGVEELELEEEPIELNEEDDLLNQALELAELQEDGSELNLEEVDDDWDEFDSLDDDEQENIYNHNFTDGDSFEDPLIVQEEASEELDSEENELYEEDPDELIEELNFHKLPKGK